MARATRSAAAAAATSTTTATAKRKRQDTIDNDEPPQKQTRRDDDAHIPTQQALSVLDILEMIDCQGLLDRVFPVFNASDTSSSLRVLLSQQDPSLPVLRAAVQHLFPISSLPRANLSPTAAQQLRFCNLAESLLSQVSRYSAIDLSLQSFLPDSEPSSSPHRPLKYALVQHLPNQDYWTSLNSDAALSNALKTLPTAHAELVAVLPTPTTAQLKHPAPTLGSYAPTRPSSSIKPLPTSRTVTTGSFLDYGLFASFAPSFDHNAQVVGRRQLGLALYASHEKRQHRPKMQRKEKGYQALTEKVFIESSIPMNDSQKEAHGSESSTFSHSVDLDTELREFLSPEDVESLKASIKTLELENAVHELLERNRRAILRLGELQIERLIDEGEHNKVVEGSEEWDLSQGIMDTLTVLSSLRPRTSVDKSPSLIPPPSLLHKLHRTLALEPSSGWHGTLPASTPTTRPAALRDDMTIRRSRSAAAVSAAPASTSSTPVPVATAAAAVPTTVANPVAMPYTGYPYTYSTAQQQQSYRTATSTTNGQSTPSQFAPFNPAYYGYGAVAAQAQAGQQAQSQQTYYGAQQQGYAAYQGWYNAYSSLHQQQQGQAGSGRNTPQPQAPPATYGSFFGGSGVGVRSPVVANTVYAPAGQAAAAVLPAHLRGVTAQGILAAQQGYYTQQQLPPVTAAAAATAATTSTPVDK